MTPYPLSKDELTVLKLGLSFCPNSNLDKYEVIKDLYLFARKLTYKFIFDPDKKRLREERELSEQIKKYSMKEFRALRDLILLLDENDTSNSSPTNEPSDTNKKLQKFKKKSDQFPDLNTNPQIAAFLMATVREIKIMPSISLPSNLPKHLNDALKNLQTRMDTIIKSSDKGGNIVLQTYGQYEKMCYDILNNQEWYRPITQELIDQFKLEFKILIYSAFTDALIDKQTYEFLNIPFPREPIFYSIPKIHKNKQNPPGRPIISGIGSITENTSRFVDFFLMPHVMSLPSYVKDTIDLLRKLDGLTISKDALFVTIDVEALYSSIPHDKGLKTVGTFLMEIDHREWKFQRLIISFLSFILKHNFFSFHGSYYLQVQGVAMGTCCAPAYANLYLGG